MSEVYWSASRTCGGETDIYRESDGASLAIVRLRESAEEHARIAALIVAAPRMLAALREASEWLGGIVDPNDIIPEDRECLARIADAIAAAEQRD